MDVQRPAELKPCPFCGAGETRIDEHKLWTGMRNVVTSAVVRHWCKPDPELAGGTWTPHMEFRGKTTEQAVARWNSRQ